MRKRINICGEMVYIYLFWLLIYVILQQTTPSWMHYPILVIFLVGLDRVRMHRERLIITVKLSEKLTATMAVTLIEAEYLIDGELTIEERQL